MYITQVFTILSLLSLVTATPSPKNYNATNTALTTTTKATESLKTVIWTSCGFGPDGNGGGCGVHTKTVLPQTTSSLPPQSQPHQYTNTTRAPTHEPTSIFFANTTTPVLTAPATVTATTNTTGVHNTTTLILTTSTAPFANHSLTTTTILTSIDLHNASTFTTAYTHTPLQSGSNYTYTGNGNYTRPSITNGHKFAAVETDSAAAISDSSSAGASVTGSSGSFSSSASSVSPPHLSALLMRLFVVTLSISSTIV